MGSLNLHLGNPSLSPRRALDPSLRLFADRRGMLARFVVSLIATFAAAASALAAPDAPWIDDAIVYGVIPALMGERGLDGVTRHMDEIATLGATVVWLSPISDAPANDFGYAVTDHFHIKPSIGGEGDLRRLVESAHAHGLKVILDIPANDLSAQHPFYRDLLEKGKDSPYRNFFARDGNGEISYYFDWANLKNLNYDNPAVRSYGIEIFAHWLRNFDVDGFRVDAAWGPRARSPDYWPAWSAALHRMKSDILLLAEASVRDPYYRDAGFDAAYDWTDQPGEWAWAGAFATDAPAMHLRKLLERADSDMRTFRFLDNNDTGRRFFTRHGKAVTRVALAMLLTLPGIPCIYMGEEVGAAFEPYTAKGPIDWKDPQHLRPYLQSLTALRHREAALHSTMMSLVVTSDDDAVLAYLRTTASPNESVLILLNYSASPVEVSLQGTAGLRDVLRGGVVDDLLDGERLALDPAAPRLELAAFSARILRPERAH